jgi:hypothetical protein
MPFFGTTPGIVAGAIILTFGLWWLGRAEKAARQKGDGFALAGTQSKGLDDPTLRERATVASEFDPASCRTVTTRSRSPRSSRQFFRSWSSSSSTSP